MRGHRGSGVSLQLKRREAIPIVKQKSRGRLTKNLLQRVFVASYKNLLEKVDTAAARKGLEGRDEADDEATTSGHSGDSAALSPRQ